MKSIHRAIPAIRSTCLVLATMGLMLGCEKEAGLKAVRFDGQRAFADVEELVRISPRDAGTPNGRKAAEHIFNRLKAHGVAAEIDTFTDQTPEGEKTMHNVVGRIPGRTDEWIILGSHFDTMPGIPDFQGANDGGSSTGVLLELARLLSRTKPDKGIQFAFFDGEEGIAGYIPGDGLHGSRHMASTLRQTGAHKKIKAMILLDMVGDKDLHFTIPANSTQSLVKELLAAAHATGHRERFSLSRLSVIIDDHVPFLEIGIPSINIIDFKFGTEPGLNDLWHTSGDHLENIRAESLEISGQIALQLVRQLAYGANAD